MVVAGLLGYLLKPAGQNIGNYRYTPFASDAGSGRWSPDGKGVAYSSTVNSVRQIFLRYLSSPNPVQVTHEKRGVSVVGWSSDRNHLIVSEDTDKNEEPYFKLYSVATVGGELEFIMDIYCITCDLSGDGKVLATLMKGKDDYYHVEVSEPLGSPLQTYNPAPFVSKQIFSGSNLCFSPDGKEILLFREGDGDKFEAWLLPYLAGQGSPRLVLQKVHAHGVTPSFSWMPDSRHLMVSLAADQNSSAHLWMADSESNDLTPITAGTAWRRVPMSLPMEKAFSTRSELTAWK